jgi:trimeric autotransporter adhesin
MRLTDYAVANVAFASGFAQGGIGSRVGVTFAW